MKRIPLAIGLAILVGPAFAQSTTPTTANGIPNTALSQEPTPSVGPRAQEADMPSNTASQANNSMLAVAPESTMPAPALTHYPLCKAGEFDHCMEPGNGPRKPGKRHRR